MFIKIGKTLINTDLIASADFVQNKHTDDVAMVHITMAGSRGGDENIVLAKDDAEAFWHFACESLVERDLTPVSQVTAGDLPDDDEADHAVRRDGEGGRRLQEYAELSAAAGRRVEQLQPVRHHRGARVRARIQRRATLRSALRHRQR